jgi:myo-inositol 2-dehydrogenase/D-chiro-inositol 1-dehydrogenase
MNKVKVGLISFAHPHQFSYLHALSKLEEVEIVGIADEDESLVESYVQQFQIPYYKDYKALLSTDVEAVIICSENVHHARLTIEAARAKKHILCEKPLGTTREEMLEMISACKLNGVQLMTAFPNRYIPTVVHAKETIDRGEIGDIIAIKGTNKGAMPGGWFIDKKLSAGGALFDHTVHVTDIMNWILRSKAVEVFAEADTLFYDLDIEDAGMVHIKYDNGVIAALDTSWSRTKAFPYKRDLTMEIMGTKGMISIDYFTQINEIYSEKSGHAEWSYWGDNKDELLISDFIKSIREGIPVSISGEDGFNSVIVALAAYESVKQKAPVTPIYGRGESDR